MVYRFFTDVPNNITIGTDQDLFICFIKDVTLFVGFNIVYVNNV